MSMSEFNYTEKIMFQKGLTRLRHGTIITPSIAIISKFEVMLFQSQNQLINKSAISKINRTTMINPQTRIKYKSDSNLFSTFKSF
jgi:sRNA-binding regulator protein Hfq